MIEQYEQFIVRKSQLTGGSGFDPLWMPDFLYDFQQSLTEWAIRQGRAAIFADCGLGKTPMQLVWAENVIRKTNGKVLIIAPLAVASQTVEEGVKFGIEVSRSNDGTAYKGITITNYERLHHFNSADFAGVVCDESSIIKNFQGVRRSEITEFMKKLEYRLLCTATAAPNDYIELGTSSEALGYLGHVDMLGRFFKNDQNSIKQRSAWRRTGGGSPKWRFKGHAEEHFWRWVSSWARALRRPSDLGFDDDGFILPELVITHHQIYAKNKREGMLFDLPASGLWEEREERRRTLQERCEKTAGLVADTGEPAVCWCHLNDEGDLLEKLIPDSVQVAGKDSADAKEEALLAFTHGDIRILVIKPKIGAWGLNWQHCAHMTFFPSHSFEQYYQAVRRSWRFGQKRPVTVDIVTTEGGVNVMKNLERKDTQADVMFSSLVRHMNNSMSIGKQDNYTKNEEVPTWL